MEFFVCSCSIAGRVIVDGKDLGPNMDDCGNLLPKQCNAGMRTVSLLFEGEKKCCPAQRKVKMKGTNPVSPLEVPFTCE